MTTITHAARRQARDWKVTPGYRILSKVGWASLLLSLYGAVVAMIGGVASAWWLTAALAAFSMLVAASLPVPVPSDLITESTWVDWRQDSRPETNVLGEAA